MKNDFSPHILEGFKARESWAFEEVYTSTRVWLFTVAYKITGEENAAQDLVQEIFTDIWEKRRQSAIDGNVKGYLLQAVRNKAINHNKQREYTEKIKRSFTGDPSFIAPVLKLEQSQLQKAIENALEKVPPASAALFVLHYVEGLSHTEIAESQNISRQTVRNQISKALKILRGELKNIKNG